MEVICGVDGCREGWIVVSKDLDSHRVSWQLCRTAHQIVHDELMPQVVAIDIPIGLTKVGPRKCDLEARCLLGPLRGRSVFTAPIRPVLTATSYEEACDARFQVDGKKMSKQAFGIMPKIKEVDELLRREQKLLEMFREVHPEISFYFLAGQRRLQHGKREKDKTGLAERRKLLDPIFGAWLHAALMDRRKLACAEDDILDAFAALWTAERIVSGVSHTIPSAPPRDVFGLRMEMVV